MATWNLCRSLAPPSPRGIALADWMARIDADVWVLTETRVDFSPGPGHALVAHSAPAADRHAHRGECWTAIWSRLPAEPVPLTADLERVAAARVGGITVVGTVVPWMTDARDLPLRGGATFCKRLAEQAADWRRLRADGGLCVAGDFNQDLLPKGRYYGSAAGKAVLRATLAECGLVCLTGDADDPLTVAPGRASIDHICVGGVRLPDHPRSTAWPPPGTLSRSLTDHYGVQAEVEAG